MWSIDDKHLTISKYAVRKLENFKVDVYDFIKARKQEVLKDGRNKFRAILQKGKEKIIFIYYEFEDEIILKTVTKTRKRGEKYG